MTLRQALLPALLLHSLTAHAAILTYSDYDPARSTVIQYNLDGNEVTETDGVMLIQVDGGPWQAAFCGDIFTGIANNTTYDANGALMSSAPYMRVAWLMTNALPLITSGNPGAGVQGAALQLAIWDILHDNGDGLQAGRIQESSNTTQAVKDAFNGYLGSAWSPTTGLVRYQLTFQGTSTQAQDVLVMVPEPGTFVLAGLPALLLWARRRRA